MQLNIFENNQGYEIKNIIFDWGGVISNIDYMKTAEAFTKLGLEDFESVYNQLKQTTLFDDLEIGTLTPEEFRNEIRNMLNFDVTDEDIDAAWTAMLLDLPPERLELLEKVRQRYNIFLLSNTNVIHVTRYSKYLDEIYGHENFKNLFIKAYYSYEIGLRKPNVEVFRHVIEENDLIPEQTLFIDDTPQHVEGASRAGLHAYHLEKPKSILEIFSNGTDKN
jgi:putative hydrolase of the HAD superfamily